MLGSPWEVLAVLAVGVLAGAINALAGGGTLLSFPLLVWLGLPAVEANATNSVALWPGAVSAAWGFRREVGELPGFWWALLVPALLGGVAGGWLLVGLPASVFQALAPWLVMAAALLVAVEGPIRRRLGLGSAGTAAPSVAGKVAAVLLVGGIAVYGGYFGAGIGILLLASLALVGLRRIHHANGVKNVLSAGMKGAAVVALALAGKVVWPAAVLMGVGAIAGGYLAAAVGRRVDERFMRAGVVVVGLLMGVAMLARFASG